MKGKDIQKIRKAFGLSPVEFAVLLGVSLSTVYRWETLEQPNVDWMQRQTLTLMKRMARKGKPKDIGANIRRSDGTLRGLLTLLETAENMLLL